MNNCLRVWVMVVVGCYLVPESKARGAKPTELIERYAQSLDKVPALRFDSDRTTYEKGRHSEDERWISTERINFVNDGDKWRFKIQQRNHYWHDGVEYHEASERESLRGSDGHVYDIRRQFTVPQPFTEETAFSLQYQLEEEPYMAVSLEDDADDYRVRAAYFRRASKVLNGYLPFDGSERLPELLKTGKLALLPPESIDGHPTVVIQGRNAFGAYVVYLDPEAEYLPRHIENIKVGSDWYGAVNQPLSSVPTTHFPGGQKQSPAVVRVRFTVDDVETTVVGDRDAITSFRAVTVWTYQDGSEYRLRELTRMSNLSYDPSPDELAMETEISNGTRVKILNAPAIRAEWRDGKLVKSLDQSTVESLAQVRFNHPKRSVLTTWLFQINVIALLILGIGFGMQRYRSRARKQSADEQIDND